MDINTTWIQVLAIIFANASISISMFFWLRTEANADRRDIAGLIREIQVEMKDFHVKLALQDQEFKHHMMNHHKE